MNMNEDITLWQGDCLELMKDIPDNSVDMILCDLPYGTTACKWDVVIPFEHLWQHYNRIIKPGAAIVLTSAQPFTSMLVMSNLDNFKYDWVWRKEKGTGHLNAKKQPMRDKEDILIFGNGVVKYNPQMIEGTPYKAKPGKSKIEDCYGLYGDVRTDNAGTRYPKQVLDFKSEGRGRVHPTQKPVALMEYLIRTYTNEGDVVMDNCMGSGTTGVACINTNRRFIGIEKDEKYFDIAANRINEALLSHKADK